MNNLSGSAGGKAVALKPAPEVCEVCGKSMKGRSWHSYLGHKGLHGFARNHFGGNEAAARYHLTQNSLALAEQGMSWRNAASPVYKNITKGERHLKSNWVLEPIA